MSTRATPSRMSAASSAITTRTGSRRGCVVPRPGSLSTTSFASSASSRSRKARQTRVGRARAPPTPSSTTTTRKRVRSAHETHRGLGRRGVLDHVGQSFRDEEVGGELDGVGQPLSNRSFHLDRERRPARERARLPPRALPRGGGSDESRGRARAARRSPPRPRPVRVNRTGERRVATEAASPSVIESVTSRCWAPSWRFRSRRRRSASVAATSRARDARTSASCARTSAARRSFSSTSPAVARTDSTSAGSSSSAGS